MKYKLGIGIVMSRKLVSSISVRTLPTQAVFQFYYSRESPEVFVKINIHGSISKILL